MGFFFFRSNDPGKSGLGCIQRDICDLYCNYTAKSGRVRVRYKDLVGAINTQESHTTDLSSTQESYVWLGLSNESTLVKFRKLS